ncbi:contractile injection system tape measure protein [Flavobacterium hauense]
MNSIGKIGLNFKGENEAFFRALYGNWESFYTKNIERSTDEVLKHFDDDELEIKLDSLELDLGHISEAHFAERFAELYKEKLAEAIQEHLYETSGTKIERISKSKMLSEILCHFLLYGSLPWNVEDKYKDINYLFLRVIKEEGAVLKQFLLTYGHYTSLQQRLVFQLEDASLEEGIRLIAPGESSFIISYVQFLQSKYKQMERPVIKESVHRNVVWEVVYAYLLNNQSSFFNKKSFIKYTVRSLSARHNTSYDQLLKIIATELENRYSNVKVTSELYSILNQLKREIPKQILEGTVSDIAKLYRVLAVTQQRNQKQWKDNKDVLVGILKKEDSCRRFLQYLDENEIIQLVKIVVPNDYVFITTYAKSLDRQKEKGVLQGKAGGEFRLLKWQIIFPILLESSSGFNRKYFVLRTLKKVASHYNLEIHEILAYFLSTEKERLTLDANLILLFGELFSELQLKSFQEKNEGFTNDPKGIVQYIRTKKELSENELAQWKVLLRNTEFREKILSELTSEAEHNNFIIMLFPQHSNVIVSYSKSLDIYQKKKALEGRTGGKFMQLKWKFIHAVLFEPQQQVFNKKYFVNRVLLRIAAHYNLKVEELIVFFYKEVIKPGNIFPFELIKVLKELYDEQLKKTIQQGISAVKTKTQSLPEEIAKKRLLYYFGTDSALFFFIKALAKEHEYVAFIEEILKAEMILRRQVAAELGIEPDNKRLLQLLMRFSGEYLAVNRITIMEQVMVYWFALISKNGKRPLFESRVQEIAKTNKLIKETLSTIAEFSEIINDGINKNESTMDKEELKSKKEELPKEEKLSTFVSNAGLVLLWPYLPRLFDMLSLTADNKFIDNEARIRAIFVMQYAVFGMTEFAEHELELNKLLTSLEADTAIPLSIELTDNEKDIINGLLNAVIQNWSKLSNTSIDGLRGNFLIRNGKLEEHEDFYQLIVEERAYDILLGSLPWSISTVKFSWMEKGINVKWR